MCAVSARLDAIWSITPHITPTYSCSTFCPIKARSTSSSGRPYSSRSARSVASSSAALLDSPPEGTSDQTQMSSASLTPASAMLPVRYGAKPSPLSPTPTINVCSRLAECSRWVSPPLRRTLTVACCGMAAGSTNPPW